MCHKMFALEEVKKTPNFWKLLKESSEERVKKVVEAMEDTLDHFGVREKRNSKADSLLRMHAFRQLDQKKWDTDDDRVKALLIMLDYFEQRLR
jgi:hypothetical protein